MWWYGVATVLGLFFAMFACEFYPVQVRWYGAVLAFVISAIFFIPVRGLVEFACFGKLIGEIDYLGIRHYKYQNQQ
jgi:hypothetical protein